MRPTTGSYIFQFIYQKGCIVSTKITKRYLPKTSYTPEQIKDINDNMSSLAQVYQFNESAKGNAIAIQKLSFQFPNVGFGVMRDLEGDWHLVITTDTIATTYAFPCAVVKYGKEFEIVILDGAEESAQEEV